MAETSYPVEDGAGVINDTYEALMAQVFGAGRVALSSVGRELTDVSASPLIYADSTGRQYKVSANQAYQLHGYRWQSGSDVIVKPLAANTSGKSRIDRAVMRLNRADYTMRVETLQGVAADVPVAPAVTQNWGSTGVWEVPLARITVTSNSGTGLPSIAPANVVEESTWLAPRSELGPSAWRSQTLPLGKWYLETDTGRVWYGSAGGSILVGENGPWTKIGSAGGWASDNVYCQRINGLTYFQCTTSLSAPSRAPNSETLICTLPDEFRPVGDLNALALLTPSQLGRVFIEASTGRVELAAFAQTFPQGGGLVIHPVSWPSKGVRR